MRIMILAAALLLTGCAAEAQRLSDGLNALGQAGQQSGMASQPHVSACGFQMPPPFGCHGPAQCVGDAQTGQAHWVYACD